MLIYTTIKELRQALFEAFKSGKSVGFVPTMGALHLGHLELVKAAKIENDITVCSIFVNPIQFNNPTDLEKYPKVLNEDITLLKSVGCDILFTPLVNEIYPYGFPELEINFGYQNTILEGEFRAGHFSGVGIVVSKLFNIVQPTSAYFGQKDFQQCLIIKQMVKELSFPIEIKIVEIVREADGLAMSSRNKRLTKEERKIAPVIYQTIEKASKEILTLSLEQMRLRANEQLQNIGIALEYMAILDFNSGTMVEEPKPDNKYAICIAAFLGEVRLIDNVVVNT